MAATSVVSCCCFMRPPPLSRQVSPDKSMCVTGGRGGTLSCCHTFTTTNRVVGSRVLDDASLHGITDARMRSTPATVRGTMILRCTNGCPPAQSISLRLRCPAQPRCLPDQDKQGSSTALAAQESVFLARC